MVSGQNSKALLEEFDALRERYKELSMEHKKTVRALDLAQRQIERNKAASEAKDNLSRVISEKRSELERFMNLLLENCPDMILLFNENGRIAYCTDSFLHLCQIPGFGIIRGKHYEELLETYTGGSFKTRMDDMFRMVYQEGLSVSRADSVKFASLDAQRSYNIQLSPMLDPEGEAQGAMLILSDSTEIMEAKQQAERASAAKSDFLATVSHEIRTPMNAIIGLTSMLRSTGLDETQQEYLRNIQDSSHVLLYLINDILDFSKIEAGKLELIPDYFRLSDMLSHLRAMFNPMFQQKNLRFTCNFAKDLPQVVCGDDKRISQIMTNLLNNALKYTPEGLVRFNVDRLSTGTLRFSVEDSGIGIRKEAIPLLFSAFERLDSVNNKSIVGTGLGLAITKSLCDLMGGEITVESRYGEGSRFTVYIPLREGTASDLRQEEGGESYHFSTRNVHALLVDDIDINLQIASYLLEPYGIAVDTAVNGREAIEKAAAKDYDIIFMDHMMPELDGIEATAIIRTLNAHSAAMPIVALTANAVSDSVQMFYAKGFQAFLSKPIDESALAACLLKWLPAEKLVDLSSQ